MLVQSTLLLVSFFLLEDPIQQEPEFRTSQVVVQEVRELLTKIEMDSPLIDKSNLALATGFVSSDLPVSESRLGEYCVGLSWSGHNQEMLNVMQRDSLNYEDRKTLTFHVGLALTTNKQFELLDRVLQGSEFKDTFLNFAYRESYARGNDRACEWIRRAG